MFKIGVQSIIFNDSKEVLLSHRRDYDMWNFPGGGAEKGESPWEAAIRETKEETGLDTKINHLVGIYSKPERNEVLFVFVCDVIGGDLTITDDADENKYFSVENIPQNIHPMQVERVHDALNQTDKPIFKVQKGKSFIDLVHLTK